MKKKTAAAALRETGEALARRVNAEPWDPPTGMVKLRCAWCEYLFAAPAEGVKLCPDCQAGAPAPP